MNARDEILARISTALGPTPTPPPVPRDYRHAEPLDPPTLTDLFEQRIRDYRATVQHTTPTELPTAIATVLAAHHARHVVTPPGLPPHWVPDATLDTGRLTPHQLDVVDAVVTAAAVGIAQTGTVVLDGSPDQGRRALTLIPDHHICVIHTHQIVHLLPDALARLDPTRPLTLISGPSATRDIELDRVEGVHGPRALTVLLAHDE